MPVNFGNYTYRPSTPLAFGGMGEGLDSIIQGNRERERLKQQESQYARTRGDSQNVNAAEFGKGRVNDAYTSQKGRYDQQAKAIADARAAMQSGHTDVADALVPTILSLGGEARKNPDGTYFFKEGGAPARGEVDVGAARRQLYQGAPPGTGANQPFQVPGFGAGGARNPFEPPAVSGASAAALPPSPAPPQSMNQGPPPAGALPTQSPPDAAGPPPGPAIDGVLPPPEPASSPAASAPEGVSSPQAEQSGSPQLTGANPFQPPGLDPYTIDPVKVRQRNSERLQPFLGGVAKAAGSPDNVNRIEAINKYVDSLGLPPAEAIKVTEKLYGEVFAGMRAEETAKYQADRIGLSNERQQSMLEEKHRDRGLRIAKERMNIEGVGEAKKKLKLAEGIYDLLDLAGKNPQIANQLIAQLYRMNQGGVMTDADFKHASEGTVSWLGAAKNFTLDKLLASRGGLNPTTVGEMREFIDTALGSHKRSVSKSMETVYRAYKEAKDPTEKQAIRETIISVFGDNPEDLPQEFRPWDDKQGGVIDIDAEDEQATMERMAAEEGGLGVVDIPAGRHPTTPMARGSRVPPKPPRKPPATTKDPKKMTDAEISEELKRLEAEANAP